MEQVKRPIQVYALSGFLGSGKTTVLQRMLKEAEAKGERAAVLMNEAGEVNLDGVLIDSGVPMAEMLGGCICCTIKSDLGMELLGLAEQYKPSVIWIESTGLAQPLEMMDAVTEASMYTHLELKGLLTVVDARHLIDRMRVGSGKTLRLMKEQIRGASLVVLNKTDLVGEDDIAEVEEQIRAWNAVATLVRTTYGQVDPEVVERAFAISRDYAEPKSAEEKPCSCGHTHSLSDDGLTDESISACSIPNHSHEDHSSELHSGNDVRLHSHVNVLTHYLSGPVDSEAFEQFLRTLPEGVYRAKGIVTFTDTINRYLFQYAYKESDFIGITPQKKVPDVAVFLGEAFDANSVLEELRKLEHNPSNA